MRESLLHHLRWENHHHWSHQGDRRESLLHHLRWENHHHWSHQGDRRESLLRHLRWENHHHWLHQGDTRERACSITWGVNHCSNYLFRRDRLFTAASLFCSIPFFTSSSSTLHFFHGLLPCCLTPCCLLSSCLRFTLFSLLFAFSPFWGHSYIIIIVILQ